MQAGRVLAVSPHLDDAALSVGALLAGLASQGSRGSCRYAVRWSTTGAAIARGPRFPRQLWSPR